MAMLHSLIARRRFGPQTQLRPLRKTLTSGLGFDDMSLAWPAVVQLLVFICSIRENTQYLACNEKCAFFTSDVYNNRNLWSCQKVCDALVYLLDNIFIRFGTKLYRQTIGIPMGTNCAPLVADLFLFCYERDFMK